MTVGNDAHLATRQVCIPRYVTELFIAKFANAALQLETCKGTCHAPEPDVPCAYMTKAEFQLRHTSMAAYVAIRLVGWQKHCSLSVQGRHRTQILIAPDELSIQCYGIVCKALFVAATVVQQTSKCTAQNAKCTAALPEHS